jgi:hypothetical protein
LTVRNDDETIRKYCSVIKKPESCCKEKNRQARKKGEISLTIGRILVYKFMAFCLRPVLVWPWPGVFGEKDRASGVQRRVNIENNKLNRSVGNKNN